MSTFTCLFIKKSIFLLMDLYQANDSPLPRYILNLYGSKYGRLLTHVVFWIVFTPLTLYWVHWALKGAPTEAYVVTVCASFLEIALAYYFFVYIGLPFLYSRKWLKLLVCLIIIYLFFNYADFFVYNFLYEHYTILKRLADPFNQNGFWLSPFQKDTFLVNWSFIISPFLVPIVLKIVKDILTIYAKAAALERDKLKLELHFLQAQIQPHFILNSLNSVYALVACTNDEAATVLLRLAGILRYALYETGNRTVWLTQEVKFLQEYIGLEAVRQHERTTLSFQSEGALAAYRIPPLLLVTFVENAFKHGINATYQQAWADIRLIMKPDGLLQFRVENSKPTTTHQTNAAKKSGIGLDNTKRRLAILFPGRHSLEITNSPETFLVNLTLQLIPATAQAVPKADLNTPNNFTQWSSESTTV